VNCGKLKIMQTSTEQLLEAIAQLPSPELETFVVQVLKLRAQRQIPHLSPSESELLLKINQSIPYPLQARFDHLVIKRQELTITEIELAELIDITEQAELLNAERMAALAELATSRQETLTQVMQDLGIHPPACV
jgi:hypothetical protein